MKIEFWYVAIQGIKSKLMPKIWCALFLIFTCSLWAEPAASPQAIYTWDNAKVDVGYFCRYSCSDIKGNAASDIYVYFPTAESMSVLKNSYLSKTSNSIDLTTYIIDKQKFYFTIVDHENLLPDTDKSYRKYHIEYDLEQGKMKASGTTIENSRDKAFNAAYKLPLGASIFYTHMGLDAGFFLRFLKDPSQAVTMNFIDTLNSVHGVKVFYEKDDILGAISCWKYQIQGQGLLASMGKKNGAVWIANDGRTPYMAKFQINVRRDWNYENWMTLLVERKPMTITEWEEFQKAIVQEQKARGKF